MSAKPPKAITIITVIGITFNAIFFLLNIYFLVLAISNGLIRPHLSQWEITVFTFCAIFLFLLGIFFPAHTLLTKNKTITKSLLALASTWIAPLAAFLLLP
jgi:hypothetical protein